MNRQGFTLIELAVVLGIIVLLTHLAMREAGQWRASQLRALADRGLAEIHEAVMGRDVERDIEGTRIRTGFLADMGRLPQAATNGAGRLTLSELWVRPAADGLFDVRAAVASNLVMGSDAADTDAEVRVPGGWRGPYLRLPLGKTRLLDAWGNAYETPDDAHHTARLRSWDDAPLTSGGTTIAVIRHLGADGTPDDVLPPASAEDADAALHFDGDGLGENVTNCTLTVTVHAYDGNGVPASGTYAGTVRVYGPIGARIAVGKQTFSLSAGTASATVSGLTPGLRLLRVECNGRKGFPRQVVVQPGANAITDRLKVE